jgi:hypothetical protein
MAAESSKKAVAGLSEFKKPIFIALTSGIGLWQTRPLTKAELFNQISAKVDARLAALMQHFGIESDGNDKWKLLSCLLAKELGLIELTTDQAKEGRPRHSSKETHELLERMNKLLSEGSCKRVEDAAKKLIKDFPNDYRGVTAKTLSNRYNAGMAESRMSLSATGTADYKKAVGEKVRSLRSRIAKKTDARRHAAQNEQLGTLVFWEQFFSHTLKALQVAEKQEHSAFARKPR